MKAQARNPYLPPYEYVPDGEPHIFDERVYIYGSHDQFNGHAYCLNDYVCYSAPVDELYDWRYEGIIFRKTDDPLNKDGSMCLYAPDVCKGTDGRYYLYYVLDKASTVSVAVCDQPAGKYEFYGYVRHKDGTLLGEKATDEPQFDPAVLLENNRVYLYTGFGGFNSIDRSGMMVTVLDEDMLTIIEDSKFVIPSKLYAKETSFESHPFFEGASIRKIDSIYYLVYSSVTMHELCYATSSHPEKGFEYRGVLVSNNDIGIDTYKPSQQPMYYGGNNHGGMVCINNQWYIFYHRHTNGTNFSRQGMAEPIEILEDGSISQVEMTSLGLNRKPFLGKGEYLTYIACNLFCSEEEMYSAPFDAWMNNQFPKITQDGRDGDVETGYIANMCDGATAGFKYFEFRNLTHITIKTRGYASGYFEVKASWNGKVLAKIPVAFTNIWTENGTDIIFPDGISALYFTFKGDGSVSFQSFTLD
jgi:arabinoxylan arabinofuranohydrolase